MKIEELKGIGEKTSALFHKVGVFETGDLIGYYPMQYILYEKPVSCAEAKEGETAAVRCLMRGKPAVRKGQRMTIVTATAADVTGQISLIWFNAPYIVSKLGRGGVFVFRGKIGMRGSRKTMEHPEVFTEEEYAGRMERLRPVYHLTKGLSNNTVIRAVNAVLPLEVPGSEYLSSGLLRTLPLIPEEEALRQIHFPADTEELAEARKRLIFDEFFNFILAMRFLREKETDAENAFPMPSHALQDVLLGSLPFELTGSQKHAFGEITEDMTGGRAMHRLLEGDVGSGKTVIAFLAMARCAENGYQSVLMAPTEVLARQHYAKLRDFLRTAGKEEECGLLIGAITEKEKKAVRQKIESGEIRYVVGTQALLQESVRFRDLGLLITDEQHRFGVRQRELLTLSDRIPHRLVMSATPIPRTLGLILYGDLAISVLDEKPAGRLPIKNALVDRSWRPQAYRFIREQVRQGHQAYVILSMIEENEELDAEGAVHYASKLRKEMPDVRIGLLHGRMDSKSKDKVMTAFASGETDILVSTTVVEVGVDVENATVMLIEDAERFGMAQLHQLRGRIGRSNIQSYCILMQGNPGDTAKERLSALASSNDGFEIAEKDFELRGPGELLGVRQSGDPAFRLADPAAHRELLLLASQTAEALLADDPAFARPENHMIRNRISLFLEQRATTVL